MSSITTGRVRRVICAGILSLTGRSFSLSVLRFVEKRLRLHPWFCAFLVPLFFLSGCGDFHFGSQSFVRTETNVGDDHTVNQTSGGVTRSIRYSGKVVFNEGRVRKISPGCVIHITEKKSGTITVAEIREEDGGPVLWMQEGGHFRLADAAERAWLEQFLHSMESTSRDVSTVEATVRARLQDPGDVDFLVPLRKLSFGDEKAALLRSVVKSPHLSPGQQVAVVQACFEHVSFSSDQVSVLLALLRRKDFSPEAKEALRGRIDGLSFDSDKITVLKVLAAK